MIISLIALICESLLLLASNARPFGIHQKLARTNRNKGSVDVHSIFILEVQDVNIVLRAQMTAHPLNSKLVRNLTALAENILTNTCELSGIENRFEFSGHKFACLIHFEFILRNKKVVRHKRLWGGGPLGSFMEVIFNQFSVRPEFKVSRTPRHWGFNDFVTDDNEDISGHGSIQSALSLKIRGLALLTKVTRKHFGTANDNTFSLQNLSKIIKFFCGFLHQMLRERLSGLSLVHVPVLLRPDSFARNMPLWNSCSVNSTDNNFFERVKLIVAVHDRLCSSGESASSGRSTLQ
mmetsp:Transcript_802/g.1343  ORF Transcript_802/g.1343 Transcript_802/m.1343 type:complete len:293 (-) Transcript_802:72-950(-)